MKDFYTKGGKKMKVFISWSGHKSFEVAKVLKEWIPCVIHNIEPYFSAEDIDKGARWSTDIAKELEAAGYGILCVTKDNLESQWLNFEAGALSKAIDKAKVCPFLFDLKPSDISRSPILQFQMTNVDREDIFKLFKSMNACLEDNRLDEGRLEKMFTAFWPQMESAFEKIEVDSKSVKEDSKTSKEKRNQNAIFEEMLELLRAQQMLLRNPQDLLPAEYVKAIFEKEDSSFEKEITMRIPRRLVAERASIFRELMNTDIAMMNNIKMSEEYVAKLKRVIELDTEILERLGLLAYGRHVIL